MKSDRTASTTPGDSKPKAHSVYFFGQTTLKRPISLVNNIQTGDLRIVPIIAVDFSMGNLTFDEELNLHSLDTPSNDYRELIHLIS